MKNQNIKAALFDLDGVVVFTDKYHYLAWKKLADENGWDFDEEVNNRLRGITRLASLEEILKHNNVTLPNEEKVILANRKNEYYKEFLSKLNETDIYDGAVEFIQKLRKRKVKIALCSASKNAKYVIETLKIANLFDSVVTGADIIKGKPDPEVFLKGSQNLGVHPFHCVVFEDSKVGIEAANTAGMRSVGVGNRKETEAIANQFINKYSEIDVDVFLECGRKQAFPISETSMIEEDFDINDLGHIESMFALGNGYLGLRGTYDEKDNEIGQVSGMYINGVFGRFPLKHLLEFKGFATHDQFTVNLPDWRVFNLYIDGEKACASNKNIISHRRELNFLSGKLCRSFIFETKSGKQCSVESIRVVNMDEVHGAEISYTVTPINFNGNVVIESLVLKNNDMNDLHYTKTLFESEENHTYTQLCSIPSTEQQISISVAHQIIGSDYKCDSDISESGFKYEVNANLMANQKITVNKYAAFAATIDNFEDLTEYTKSLAEKNREKGTDVLFKNQAAFWNAHWENADIKISGNSADQQAVRYSLFQLRQQLSTTNACSIGATGLTGPGYSGKVFWDTEMYLMPYYNFTYPETQKDLLMYRYRILDKARARAMEFDAPGAMYSWASIDGEETSFIYEASTAEYHLNSDIVYAIWRYVDTTEDKEFLYNYGAEIVFETAKFMSWRGTFSKARGGRFCLNAVCGPDEYACGVNNNCYTNFMLRFHLNFALEIVKEMKAFVPEKFDKLCKKIHLSDSDFSLWKKAADNIYYSYNEEYGIYEQDDSFLYEDEVDMTSLPMNYDIRFLYHPLDLWRLQVSKQADVVLLNFVLGNLFTKEEKERCYDYYEPRCNHGSSLSTAVHSIMAQELGRPEAYEYFRCSAYMDIGDFKKNTNNGIHIACLGGVWMSVVNGFLGMRHSIDGISFKPNIPTVWKEYNCRVNYKNSLIEINVCKQKVTFALVKGETISFKVYENSVVLDKTNALYEYVF